MLLIIHSQMLINRIITNNISKFVNKNKLTLNYIVIIMKVIIYFIIRMHSNY